MSNDNNGSTDSNSRFGRRTLLVGAGSAAVGISAVAGAGSVLAGDDADGTGKGAHANGTDTGADTAAAQFQGVHHNEAVLWDHDMDMAFTNRMRLAADPAGGDRVDVVHVTSAGEESSDYAVSGIDLRAADHSLGDIHDAGFTYDYFKGERASYKVPDEVFLILQTTDGEIAVTYRKADADQTGVWETRDVSSELTAGGWREFGVDAGDIDVEDEQVRVTAETIGNNIMALREQDHYENVLDRFGTETSVLAVAIGNGSVDGVVSDAYFNNVQIGETTYTVPATVSVEPTVASQRGRGGGRVTVSLTFTDDQYGLSMDGVDPESVRIAPYSSFGPPIPGTGDPSDVARAEDASVSGDALEAEFVPGQIQRLVSGNRPTTVLVFGGFEEEPYRFVGVAELEGVGGGN